MATINMPGLPKEGQRHKRTTSSVLKSIITPRNHQRNPSVDASLSPSKVEDATQTWLRATNKTPLLPLDHPHGIQPSQDEGHDTERLRSPSKKPIEVYDDDRSREPGLLKKTKSSVSLKSLVGKDKEKSQKSRAKDMHEDKPKKSKSSTNLSALLSRPKPSKVSKRENAQQIKDKENQTPPSSATTAPPTPIWAQFATQHMQDISNTTRIPFNDWNNIDNEATLYTPQEYSPSKQRNFQDYYQPTLSRTPESKARPKSEYLVSGHSTKSFADTISGLRKTPIDRSHEPMSNQRSAAQQVQKDENRNHKTPSEARASTRENAIDQRKLSNESSQSGFTMAKRGSRVMAAVAALNGRSQDPAKGAPELKVDSKAIECAFESLLESRNIPQNMREKMRSLDVSIKTDFIRQDKSGFVPSSSGGSLSMQAPNISPSKKAAIGPRSKTNDETPLADPDQPKTAESECSPKKSRPRSRTFTLSKGDSSPSKKQKAERAISHGRAKSIELTTSGSSKSLTSAGAAQALSLMGKAPRSATPEDFISYLQTVRKPETVEVGKLHKLRQLLRNETVSWVDAFIMKGGMAEVVSLLYRTINVEWREEHEDTLLHETLLCIKALCTTSLAVQHLSTIQSTLFPTLLAMLFDEEKKGPSEFSTRSIVLSLLFTYLSSSPRPDLVSRAHTILSYLRDPSQPEDTQPPGFITSIYHPRPYRVWCKEVVNVTKEVFWIFLHHLNIIPYPPISDPTASYTASHFPQDRPPVPAAPYVGGVEWEATNYLAAHLDLLNGIIASIPTREERNNLRQELKDSGFEKCMGGSLRTCKEKFYGGVHAGLGTWVSAARVDGWEVGAVREGPKREEGLRTRSASPKKGKGVEAPRLELGVQGAEGKGMGIGIAEGGWL